MPSKTVPTLEQAVFAAKAYGIAQWTTMAVFFLWIKLMGLSDELVWTGPWWGFGFVALFAAFTVLFMRRVLQAGRLPRRPLGEFRVPSRSEASRMHRAVLKGSPVEAARVILGLGRNNDTVEEAVRRLQSDPSWVSWIQEFRQQQRKALWQTPPQVLILVIVAAALVGALVVDVLRGPPFVLVPRAGLLISLYNIIAIGWGLPAGVMEQHARYDAWVKARDAWRSRLASTS